jgi:hypothetical protein
MSVFAAMSAILLYSVVKELISPISDASDLRPLFNYQFGNTGRPVPACRGFGNLL